jgi:hypothetical protein
VERARSAGYRAGADAGCAADRSCAPPARVLRRHGRDRRRRDGTADGVCAAQRANLGRLCARQEAGASHFDRAGRVRHEPPDQSAHVQAPADEMVGQGGEPNATDACRDSGWGGCQGTSSRAIDTSDLRNWPLQVDGVGLPQLRSTPRLFVLRHPVPPKSRWPFERSNAEGRRAGSISAATYRTTACNVSSAASAAGSDRWQRCRRRNRVAALSSIWPAEVPRHAHPCEPERTSVRRISGFLNPSRRPSSMRRRVRTIRSSDLSRSSLQVIDLE